MSPRYLLILPLLALASCETPYPPMPEKGELPGPGASDPIPLRKAPAPAPQRVDVYRSSSEIKGLHRVIGEVRLATDGRESPETIRNTFERQARSRNAQGVIIQDPADRPYGGSAGPAFDQPREITASFIRYDDRRASGYNPGGPSPYSSQRQSPGSSYDQ
ncbi:MAG: hypothetical protein EOP86_15785 [Verrucomicrobiaceae bacterium]|nr:MAG: hypothetical protein EOP86_15785 [Verrucomicrobiaceae bacterium]